MTRLTPDLRRWIYGVAIAALPLLIAFGVITEVDAPLWAALVGAILVPSLAVANTPTTGQATPADDVEFNNPDSPQFDTETR